MGVEPTPTVWAESPDLEDAEFEGASPGLMAVDLRVEMTILVIWKRLLRSQS